MQVERLTCLLYIHTNELLKSHVAAVGGIGHPEMYSEHVEGADDDDYSVADFLRCWSHQ